MEVKSVAMEEEDDVFFAELSKQISLIIMDDEEESTAVHCPSVSFEAFSRAIHQNARTSFLYEQNCRMESKGTGVFIPRLSQTRRKNCRGRFTSCNTKYQRQPNDSRGLDPHVSYNNNPKKVLSRDG